MGHLWQRDFAPIAKTFDQRLQGGKQRDRCRCPGKHSENTDHRISSSFTAAGDAGSWAVAEHGHSNAEAHSAGKNAAEKSRPDMERSSIHGHKRINANGAHHDGGSHGLHYRPVAKQELSDNDLELGHSSLLEKKAKYDSRNQSENEFVR